MFRVMCLVIGYAFGLIQTAFVIGKLNGIDIREHGSGNAGTTNTMRVLGTKQDFLSLSVTVSNVSLPYWYVLRYARAF